MSSPPDPEANRKLLPPDDSKNAALLRKRPIPTLSKFFFYVAALTYSLNAITLWRLPYIFARHGIAYMIAFTVCSFVITCPLLCGEIFLGQLIWSQSYVAWAKLNPYLCGVGLSSFIFMLYTTIYSSTPIAWSLALSWHSFANVLEVPFLLARPSSPMNRTIEPPWIGRNNSETLQLLPSTAIDFFHNTLLMVVPEIEAMTELKHYFACEVVAGIIIFWLIVFLLVLLHRHLHKIAVVFSILFLAIFTAAIVASAILSPAAQNSFLGGMFQLIKWDGPSRLLVPELWFDAASQSLLAVGAMSGFVWVSAAHLPLRSNYICDAFALTIHHLIMSCAALVFVYAGLGAYSVDGKTDIWQKVGPSLPFIGFLGIFSNWTTNTFITYIVPIVFFVLFALVQACCHAFNIVAAVYVLYHSQLPNPIRNIAFASVAVCLFLMVFSHPFTTSMGIYLLQGIDDYVLPFVALALAAAEIFLSAWALSWPRIREGTTRAIGKAPCICCAIMWRFLAPLFALVALGAGVAGRVLNPPGYLAYSSAESAKADSGYLQFAKYPLHMFWMEIALVALAVLPIFILPLLRKCRCIKFTEAPLRTASGVHELVPAHDYDFPFIDDSVNEEL